MSRFEKTLLVSVLLAPGKASGLSGQGWDILIRQARRANVLGLLAARFQRDDQLRDVPAGPRQHLESALLMVCRQARAVHWELSCISRALASENLSAIVLKGAAYAASGVQAGEGRIFSDVDILVRKTDIATVESALMIHGWRGAKTDAYDQKYYRLWMHELPPLVHVTRGTTIDVHHAIVPPTARVKADSAPLFYAPQPLDGFDNLFVFSPAMMLLHSAAHLFQEGELDNGLRDLFDIDALIREFGASPSFWEAILAAGQETGLGRFVYYALHYAQSELESPVPADVLDRLKPFTPPRLVGLALDVCYRRAFRPNHDSCAVTGGALARRALYLRSHWLRMPLVMLLPHLLRKTWSGLGKTGDLPRADV